MGASVRKRASFLAAHPNCCFCGGVSLATTIDHIPARACFKGRAYPEGFEFPACLDCQGRSRHDEQVFSFLVRVMDFNNENFDPKALDRAVSGMVNNFPHFLPDFDLSANDKRRSLRQMGISKPSEVLATELPIVGLNPNIHEHILRYTRKIACALFYKEKGRAVPVGYFTWSTWGQVVNPQLRTSLRKFVEMTPAVAQGRRTNMNFGDQFSYRYNKADDPDVLAVLMQFGRGMVVPLIVIDAASMPKMNHQNEWKLALSF